MSTRALEALSTQLDDQLNGLEVPGLAVGMIVDGEEHVICRGVTNVRHPLSVDDSTLFQVGSTTKTLTATAALRLADEGRIALDDPVRRVLPALRLADEDVASQVTLRHLLTHTGGWESDTMAAFGSGDDALARFVDAMRDLPQLAPLGFWGYQNSAFSLAGRLIEVVTGAPYERAMLDLVLAPLGMDHSMFAASDAIIHRVAVGHRPGAQGPEPSLPWELDRAMNPAGGLASSVRDQLRYARFHLGDGTTPDGERLLRAETLRAMRAPQAEAGGGYAASIGLGWLLQATPGLIAHGGSTNGQESAFALIPERGFAFTVLTNSLAGAVLQRSLTKWAIREIAGVTPARPQLEESAPWERARVVGAYHSGGSEVTVERGADTLLFTVSPTSAMLDRYPGSPTFGPMPATLYKGGRFRLVAGEMRGATGEFLGGEGTATHVRLNGRIHARAG